MKRKKKDKVIDKALDKAIDKSALTLRNAALASFMSSVKESSRTAQLFEEELRDRAKMLSMQSPFDSYHYSGMSAKYPGSPVQPKNASWQNSSSPSNVSPSSSKPHRLLAFDDAVFELRIKFPTTGDSVGAQTKVSSDILIHDLNVVPYLLEKTVADLIDKLRNHPEGKNICNALNLYKAEHSPQIPEMLMVDDLEDDPNSGSPPEPEEQTMERDDEGCIDGTYAAEHGGDIRLANASFGTT